MFSRTISLVGIVLSWPTIAHAQEGPQWYEGHVSLMAGVSVFDRSGAGTMGIYALRADMPLYPSLIVEGGLSYARRQDQGIGDIFIPGVQVHLQGTTGQFSPYLGIGSGLTVETSASDGPNDISFSPSFSAGARVALTEGAGLRVEGRLNSVGANFRGVYSELVTGLSVAW